MRTRLQLLVTATAAAVILAACGGGGTLNPYGRVLGGLSLYLQNQGVTLQSLRTTPFSTPQWTQVSSQFNTAYLAANPGSSVTFNVDGNAFFVGGACGA